MAVQLLLHLDRIKTSSNVYLAGVGPIQSSLSTETHSEVCPLMESSYIRQKRFKRRPALAILSYLILSYLTLPYLTL